MTDTKAAEFITRQLGDKIREPITRDGVAYTRNELFGKLHDKHGGRNKTVVVDHFEECRRLEVLIIHLARSHRDLLQRFGETVPVSIQAIAETPTWSERS